MKAQTQTDKLEAGHCARPTNLLRFQAKGHVRITHGLLLVHCISTQERLQAVALAARTNGYLHSFIPFEFI